MGYVPQDVFLFSETIEDNIQFSPRDRDNPAVLSPENASEHASIHEEIKSFMMDINTRWRTRCNTLRGQKQRISLARASPCKLTIHFAA